MKILHNATIHTLNPGQPIAQALVIDHHAPHSGRIIEIGPSEAILAAYSRHAEVEDMDGAVLLPSLTDAHIHLRHYANFLQSINLFGASKQACLDKVAQQAANTPPGEWIQGYGWSQDNWDGIFPNAEELQAVAPDHPVLLMGVSLHVIWVNHNALQAAGIDATTPDPPNGVIKRDDDGQLTGLIFEEAMSLFNHVLPDPAAKATLDLYQNAQQQLWQMGITGVHDFDRIPSFIALQTLHRQGKLKLRVTKNLPVKSLDYIINSGLRTGFGDDLLRIGHIKAFADGALGSRTAAMFTPYKDDPANTGMLLLDGETMLEFGQKAAANGLALTIHAIGDAANHQILNGFEQLRRFERKKHLPHYRHRVEHVQLLHAQDLSRLAQLDLIASMQPIHATSDIEMANIGWGERSRYAYAWRTLLDANTRLAFGSDSPVDSPNPFFGLHAAVTRQRANGYPGPDGWYPQERIGLLEALKAYTSGAAYITGMEDRLGMLAPSYLADLIVLEKDPFSIPTEELRGLAPTATMLGGDWVYQS
jgi:predicted amidohydrolase YtcJ